PSDVVSNIGRQSRSQPSFEARLIHEYHPSKTQPSTGVVPMGSEGPNDSRTSNKRDEIRAASLPPRLHAALQEIIRICGDLATSRRLKTCTLNEACGRVQAGRYADRAVSLLGH